METGTMPIDELKIDRNGLFREETFTDMRAGSIRRLTPVTADGQPDASRPVLFIGQTQIMSQLGLLPVQCEIQAANLSEALDRFPAADNRAINEMVAEARELRRQEAGRIVAPTPEQTSKIITG